MDAKDVLKLMDLLDIVCANTPKAKRAQRDKNTICAWTLALEPFTYEEAKKGALAHTRQNRFYPSVSEIIANIPQEADRTGYRLNPEEIQQMRRHIRQLQQDAAQLRGSAGKELPNEI